MRDQAEAGLPWLRIISSLFSLIFVVLNLVALALHLADGEVLAATMSLIQGGFCLFLIWIVWDTP